MPRSGVLDFEFNPKFRFYFYDRPPASSFNRIPSSPTEKERHTRAPTVVYHGQRRGYCRDMMEATWFMLIGAVVLIVGLVLVRRESKSKGRWGTGSFSASCPRCGARLPTLRKVASIGEAMWGGWTCEKCACKVDRYGREREG
jgi:hypothetical protein